MNIHNHSCINQIQGPWEWADAMFLDPTGDKLVVHVESTFVLQGEKIYRLPKFILSHIKKSMKEIQ